MSSKIFKFAPVAVVFFILGFLGYATYINLAEAQFVGPGCAAGQNCSPIVVGGGNTVAIGTSTASSSAQLLVRASGTTYAITALGKILSGSGGFVFPDGTTQTTAAILSSTSSAINISAGSFGANTGGGNYSFPASLGIGTASINNNLSLLAAAGAITDLKSGDTAVISGDMLGTIEFRGEDATVTNQIGAKIVGVADGTWGGTSNDAPARIDFYTRADGGADTFASADVSIGQDGTVTVGGGSGKVNVGTVDPIYTIGGKRYATYLPGMTGQKEETTGIVSCGGPVCSSVVDFRNLEEGSDLWLFAKAVNLEKDEAHFRAMTVLLSPAFEGRVWYKKDVANRTLTINVMAAEAGTQNAEVSYRLTAPRFDSAEWSNFSDDAYEGFNLDKLIK